MYHIAFFSFDISLSHMQYEDESGALMMLPADLFLLLDKVILVCFRIIF